VNIFKNVKKYLRILRKALFYSMMDIVWLISGLVPKDKNLWVFGSWFGNKFADNSKYLFLSVKKYHPEIRPVWLSRNPKVVSELREMGCEAYTTYSIKGFFLSMRAGAVVVSTGLSDVNRYAISKSKKVQLWHGTPLKKIGYDNTYFSNKFQRTSKFKLIMYKLLFFSNNLYDLVIATSNESREKMISASRVDKNKVVVTGYPRNDILFSKSWLTSTSCYYIDRIKKRINFKYTFAYIPTCRGIGYKTVDLFYKYKFDIQTMERTLENLDGILVIKPHHYNKFILNETGFTSIKRIFILPDQELPDIYPLIKQTDVLITDYSSIYFDFLLLNRPIIFAPFDIEEFINTTDEFYYDYETVTPGPKAKDWDEVLTYMLESISDKKKYESERVMVKVQGEYMRLY